MPKKVEVKKCSVCGKVLKNGETGKLCAHRLQSGQNASTMMIGRTKFQITKAQAESKSFISIAKLHKICEAHFVPVSKMLKSIGGDTSVAVPVHPIAQVYWNGKIRYVSAWLSTKTGLEAMLTQNFKKAPENQATKKVEPKAEPKADPAIA